MSLAPSITSDAEPAGELDDLHWVAPKPVGDRQDHRPCGVAPAMLDARKIRRMNARQASQTLLAHSPLIPELLDRPPESEMLG